MVDNKYWAGFFDGEGYVTINKVGGVVVGISQKRAEVLGLMIEQFGGTISNNHGPETSAWRTGQADEVKNFLSMIYPHSIVKREEIEIGLKAAELIRRNNQGCVPLTFAEMEDRMKLRDELQALRPKKTFTKIASKIKIERDAIKDQHDHKCSMCREDLRGTNLSFQIISDGKLICRRCHCRRLPREVKHVSKESIENALASTSNLDEACAILGINRSSLYKKRMKHGLPIMRLQKLI